MNYFAYMNKGFELISIYYKVETLEEKKKVLSLMDEYYKEKDSIDTSLITNEINNVMRSLFKLYHLFFLVKDDPVIELKIADKIYESLLEVKKYINENIDISENALALVELEKTLREIKL